MKEPGFMSAQQVLRDGSTQTIAKGNDAIAHPE